MFYLTYFCLYFVECRAQHKKPICSFKRHPFVVSSAYNSSAGWTTSPTSTALTSPWTDISCNQPLDLSRRPSRKKATGSIPKVAAVAMATNSGWNPFRPIGSVGRGTRLLPISLKRWLVGRLRECEVHRWFLLWTVVSMDYSMSSLCQIDEFALTDRLTTLSLNVGRR